MEDFHLTFDFDFDIEEDDAADDNFIDLNLFYRINLVI